MTKPSSRPFSFCVRHLVSCAAALFMTTAVLAQPGGTISDPPGDATGIKPNLLFGLPFGGPLDVSGDQVTMVFPDTLLATPIDDWSAATFLGTSLIDRLPDSGQVMGTGASVGDPPDPGLEGIEDLESAAVLLMGTDITFQLLFREFGAPGSRGAGFFIDSDGSGAGIFERVFGLLPVGTATDGWVPYVNDLSIDFPYRSKSYYDIRRVSVERNGDTVTVAMTVAGNIPSSPPELSEAKPYAPSWAITFDTDGNPATGDGAGFDTLFFAYAALGGVQTGVRAFNGTYYDIVGGTPGVSIVGDTLTLTFSASAFGIQTGYRWVARVDLAASGSSASSPNDYFFGQVDGTAIVEEPIQSDDFDDGTLGGWDQVVQ